MLHHRDFVPQMRDPGGFFTAAEYDSFDAAVSAAGQWIDTTGVDVVTVETVVLPNIHRAGEEGSGDPALRSSGEMSSSWHQFVRVWYRTR
jgi:hypothetical protein